jgi:hypothetical protein
LAEIFTPVAQSFRSDHFQFAIGQRGIEAAAAGSLAKLPWTLVAQPAP